MSQLGVNPVTNSAIIQVGRPGRDELFLNFEIDAAGILKSAHLRAIGCPELLKLVAEFRPKLAGSLSQLPLPTGSGHSELLLRECLLRARGEWQPPYTDLELCHCRRVATAVVDEAIVCGARSVAAVSRETSAGTSCGTCKTDIEALLAYRKV